MAKNTLPTTDALRKKKDKDLHDLLRSYYAQFSSTKIAIAMKKEKNTASIKNIRVMIARIKTVMGEKREMRALQVETKK